jgi:hypothetical protein
MNIRWQLQLPRWKRRPARAEMEEWKFAFYPRPRFPAGAFSSHIEGQKSKVEIDHDF